FPFFTRSIQKKRQRREPEPVFIKEKCIGCSRCVNICPAKALTLVNEEEKHIEANYNKCIRCYCCHEMCPVAAIEIPKN
ncbi:MAG: 4Fe-4S binding protein, partial [Sphaerochaetaceae bacterium]|nr:4Fe-4S binding protein [Sphaerochaetaceae bacterium]